MKRAYSVYQKLKRQKIALDQVYDLLALRIITDSVKNCYAALGVIHNEWRPVPGRIKDFIAIPRPNLYQSLHTSVVGPGRPALRSADPHRRDAPHRRGRHRGALEVQGRRKGRAQDDQRVAWLRQLVEWQQEMRDPGEFMSTLKVDLYPEEVYSFTPSGKVIVLPRDATPIDFAYAMHTDVGNTCVGAKVNGRIVPLKYVLRNGDVVEILTQPGHLPSKDWLALVKTSARATKSSTSSTRPSAAKAIEIGQKYLEKEARRLGVQLRRDHESRAGARGRRVRLRQDRGSVRRARLRQVFGAPGAAESWRPSRWQPQRFRGSAPEARARRRTARRRPRTTTWSSRSKASTICWSIARSAAIRSAAKASWDTSRAARASRCIPSTAPTCRT